LTLEEYKDHIDFVLESCPDAKPEDIASELARYENEFKIPAQDAVHSVIRKFKTNADVPVSKSSEVHLEPLPHKESREIR